jgi:hypothetical protein
MSIELKGHDAWKLAHPKHWNDRECRKCLSAPKWIEDMGLQPCSTCNGTLLQTVVTLRDGYTVIERFRCVECEGAREAGTENCDRCGGSGLDPCTGNWKRCGCPDCADAADRAMEEMRDRRLED